MQLTTTEQAKHLKRRSSFGFEEALSVMARTIAKAEAVDDDEEEQT